ncbi:MAG TPA: ABC transporter substrate-binding protein [Solirubrobacteraceae bacterium]|nr:ABC transporter substrate-binding protein [Solirubrobacteraceae bacterium]
MPAPRISSWRAVLLPAALALAGAAAGCGGTRSVVQGDGGDPAKVRTVTIGFQAVPALLVGRVAGATGFWNAEGVALARRRPGTRVFRVDDYGAPPYPELVLATTRQTARDDPALVHGTIAALRRGYDAAVRSPAAALGALEAVAPGTDRATAAAEFAAVRPALIAPGGRFGTLDPAVLRRWAAWEARFGIVPRPPRVGTVFDTRAANAP